MKKKLSLFVLYYLRFFARLQLAKVKFIQNLKIRPLKIVGITGSAGKSSTLAACKAALSPFFKVKTNEGSNSESGIPLSILGIKVEGYSPLHWLKYLFLAPVMLLSNWHTFEIYLCEMGIDEPTSPKNMSYLLTILKPHIGIFLNVTSVHSLQFDPTVPSSITGEKRQQHILTNIANEKAKMINSLPPGAPALVNLSDPIISQIKFKKDINLIHLTPTRLSLPYYALPPAFDISINAAFKLCQLLGIEQAKASKAIADNIKLPPSRSSKFKGIHNSTVIDSSYNSSPLATSEMLKLLSTYPTPRITILGDMRELGQQSEIAHKQLYQIARKSADVIISVGPLTSQYFGSKAIKFTYWWQAFEYLTSHPLLLKNSTILVKGSQNTIYLEELVKGLLQNTSDNDKLCRQSSYWLSIKAKFRSSATK